MPHYSSHGYSHPYSRQILCGHGATDRGAVVEPQGEVPVEGAVVGGRHRRIGGMRIRSSGLKEALSPPSEEGSGPGWSTSLHPPLNRKGDRGSALAFAACLSLEAASAQKFFPPSFTVLIGPYKTLKTVHF